MIHLEIPEDIRDHYTEWFELNKGELYTFFDQNYRQGSNNAWLKDSSDSSLRKYVKTISKGKCGYCERKPNDGGGYLELDHFHPKSEPEFYEEVFSIDNLVPACKQCNANKGTKYKTAAFGEMLNPYKATDLISHLRLIGSSGKIDGISPAGKSTVSLLNKSLNTKEFIYHDQKGDACTATGALVPRFIICESMNKKIKKILSRIDEVSLQITFEEVEGVIEKIAPEESFIATRATILLNSAGFKQILEVIKERDLGRFYILEKKVEDLKQYLLTFHV